MIIGRKLYTVVTRGTPAPVGRPMRWTADLDRAKRYASAIQGTGTCSVARVVQIPRVSDSWKADIGGDFPVIYEV